MIHALDIETEDTSEGWSRDVSADFATELQRRTDLEGKELTGTLAEFVLHDLHTLFVDTDQWEAAYRVERPSSFTSTISRAGGCGRRP